MVSSRIDKYRDLRSGLKDEVGISRDNISNIVDDYDNDDTDDFLASVNRFFNKSSSDNSKNEIEDTLTEAKTFEQMRNENNEELNRALRSAKVSVGKEAQYNTRMDILNKIREPEKQTIRVNNFDNVETSQFSKGYFINPDVKAQTEEKLEQPKDDKIKERMTLMERLASMSPVEDAKKAKIILDDEEAETQENLEEGSSNLIEQTNSLEDMLRYVKEKDQREVEKALKKKADEKMIKDEAVVKNDSEEEIESRVERVEIVEEKRSNRIVNVLNCIIVFLIVIFVVLCGMIGYQLFF